MLLLLRRSNFAALRKEASVMLLILRGPTFAAEFEKLALCCWFCETFYVEFVRARIMLLFCETTTLLRQLRARIPADSKATAFASVTVEARVMKQPAFAGRPIEIMLRASAKSSRCAAGFARPPLCLRLRETRVVLLV
jgi:hypothetical protein